MRPKLTTTLLFLSLPLGVVLENIGGLNVCLAQQPAYEKRPTPSPTPPPGGPGTENIGGPGKTTSATTAAGEPAANTAGGTRRLVFSDFISTPRVKSGRRIRVATPSTSKTCDPTEQQEEDFTGTYSGNIEFPDHELSRRGTLIVEGRSFKLVSDDVVLSGKIASETTCNYTAVALRFETSSLPEISANLPQSISLRARAADSGVSLVSVEGETKFAFTPASNTTRRRP